MKVIEQLKGKYETTPSGIVTPLTIHEGKTHDYLGMTLDYSIDGKVIINMRDYVKKLLDDLPSAFRDSATTPAANYLFEVNDACKELDKEDSDFFHHVVAQLLFLSKRGRPDLLTSVAFLTT